MTKPAPPSELLDRFRMIVGSKHAVADPPEQEPYLVEMRGLYHGHTPLVLRPGSSAEVSAIMKLAHETRTPIVPQGGNTGLVGGQVPLAGELVLSMTRLDRIREVDVTSSTMTCEAGVVLAKAQEAAAKVDRLFPLSLAAEGSCTIGGNLSTNAGGTAVLAYGNARELVLGIEVVLADGRMLDGLGKLKKDNTGYDLKHLFIGAEGTLGIITAAVLKLFPRPRETETAFVGLSSPRAALALFNLAEERGHLTAFELMARIAVEFAIRHGAGVRDPLGTAHPWYVLLELASTAREGTPVMQEILEDAAKRGLLADAALAASIEQAQSFWRLRHQISDAQRFEGGSIKHDVSVPVAAVPDFIAAATTAAEALIQGCRPVAFGHLGDGNIHFNVSQPIGGDKAEFLAQWGVMNSRIHQIVLDFHGSISAEHGIGRLKRDLLPRVKDPVALDVMRALKRTLDPHGILNPGKLL
jgi:FAD/FMN-containing dehydrogenase